MEQPGGGIPSQQDSSNVTFCSYNMTGADKAKCEWINDILNEFNVDFVSLQEHFKTVKTTDKWFRSQFHDWQTFVIPAFRQQNVDSGRGIGGLVQLSNNTMKISKQRILSKSPRIQAQRIMFPNLKVLWINTYMPCDSQNSKSDNLELITTLSEVENIINSNKDCETVWSGDMNWEMSRKTEFSNIFHSIVEKLKVQTL